MKRLTLKTLSFIICLLSFCPVRAQESHYHKGLRSQEDNDKMGTVAADPHFDGGGVYWSRVRNIDDIAITHESEADSIARRESFKTLCQQAYDAYETKDYYHTILYGDSALAKHYHTPELYYFMAVAFDQYSDYKNAELFYKRALKAGHVPAIEPYNDFKRRMKEQKQEEKKRKKQLKERPN